MGADCLRDKYKLARGNGIFITTNIFTTEAKKFADDNMIEVVDGYKLLKLVRLAGDVSIPENLTVPSDIASVCPRCGGKMILRNSHRGSFYGCSNYPKCRFIKNIK